MLYSINVNKIHYYQIYIFQIDNLLRDIKYIYIDDSSSTTQFLSNQMLCRIRII